MDRRSFIGGLLTLIAGTHAIPAWAARTGSKKTSQNPFSDANPVPHTTAQLKEQVLDDVRELGQFRLLYLSTHPDPSRSHLVVVNAASTRVEMAVPINISKRHSVVLSPGVNPEYALLPEIDGPCAVLVDLKKGTVVADLKPSVAGHVFSGHAIFSPDGKFLYLPESPEDRGASRGLVVARAVPSMEIRKSYDTGCFRPHDLRFNKAGTVLMVGHYGRSVHDHEPPSDGGVALLEMPSGKRLPAATPENPYLALCHLESDDHDNVYISTRSWIGPKVQLMTPILFGTMNATAWESRLPEELKERFRFNFSLKLAKQAGILAVAHINGKMVSFWNAKEKTYLGMIDFGQENPLGLEVTPDERFFLINTNGGALYFVDVKTRKITKQSTLIGLSGSPHISVLPLPT